jgi:phage tail-like protein
MEVEPMPLLQREQAGSGTLTGLGKKYKGDELKNCNYALEINGLVSGLFSSLTGGEMEIAVIEHDVVFETGDSTTLFIPGPISFKPIVLSRGFAFNEELYNWLNASVQGDTINARRNGSITLNEKTPVRDGNGNVVRIDYMPIVRWNLYNAWLSKIDGFSSNSYTATKVASLKITIVAETIERSEA